MKLKYHPVKNKEDEILKQLEELKERVKALEKTKTTRTKRKTTNDGK